MPQQERHISPKAKSHNANESMRTRLSNLIQKDQVLLAPVDIASSIRVSSPFIYIPHYHAIRGRPTTLLHLFNPALFRLRTLIIFPPLPLIRR